MENLIATIAYLFIGILLRLTGRLPKDFSTSLNLFVIYVSLPALVLLKVVKMDIGQGLFFVTLLPWVMAATGAVMVLILSRIFNWSREITGCLLLMCSLGNTSFLGIPMVRAFFGEKGITYAIIYDQLGSFLALATYGSIVLALYARDDKTKPNFKEIVLKICTFPPFMALVLAFLLRGITFPGYLQGILTSMAATLIPVVMIAVGYQLHLKLDPGAFAPMAVGLLIKLVAAPLIALIITKLFGLRGEPVKVAIFESGMPPMVSAGALAIMANLAPKLTAALVGSGIFLSFITLPLLFKLIAFFI